MTPTLWTRWTRKELVLILAIVTFVCAVIFLSISLARPKPVASATLGADWQCRKALFATTCTRTLHSKSMLHSSHLAPVCPRRV